MCVTVIDAMGKPPSGILDVDLVWPGQYDECVNISTRYNSTTYGGDVFLMKGKYFLSQLYSPLPVPEELINLQDAVSQYGYFTVQSSCYLLCRV